MAVSMRQRNGRSAQGAPDGAAPRHGAAASDGELLDRFRTRGDEAAFAVLVQRHGPLVQGVCRRVLQHVEDAEDAFQATFLILARKAGCIAKNDSLASWLYKVAYRIALRAAKSRRRTPPESAIRPGLPSSLVEVASRELGRVIDEELQRLPEKYRRPILLCYLQGHTNEEAARQLRLPTGTVKIRLLRARELLRQRLGRRGLDLTASVLAVALLHGSSLAQVPAPLAAATVLAACQGTASTSVAGLVSATLAKMCVTKLKIALALLLTILVGALADGLAQHALANPAAVRLKPAPPAADSDPPSWSEPVPIFIGHSEAVSCPE